MDAWPTARLILRRARPGEAGASPTAPPAAAAPIAPAGLADRLWARARAENWAVGVIRAPLGDVLEGKAEPLIHFIPSPEPLAFWADPFYLEDGEGRPFLACEEFDYRRLEGRIALVDLGGGEPRRLDGDLLGTGIHMSYPFSFTWEGEHFILPEAFATGRLTLYSAPRPQGPWRELGVLLEGRRAADPCLLQHDGRWWLFFTDQAQGSESHLHVFHAPRPLGPWIPLPQNPVKVDRASARGGGPLFRHKGGLYRPAQDCTATYGGRLVVNRVLELTPETLREEPAFWLEPDPEGPYPHGLHTLCPAGGWTLVDGKRHFICPTALKRRFLRKMKSLLGK